MKKLLTIITLLTILLSSCDSINSLINNKDVNDMVQVMENFHTECIGESKHFQGSGERSLFRVWDNNYDKSDVDKAINILKPTLLTDNEISKERIGYIILNMSDRVID